MKQSRWLLRHCPKLHYNKHPMGCDTQLAWKCLFTPTFLAGSFDPYRRSGSPVFSVLSGFVSRCFHARLQICVQQLRFVPVQMHALTHRDRQHFDQLIWIDQPAVHEGHHERYSFLLVNDVYCIVSHILKVLFCFILFRLFFVHNKL